MKFDIVQVLEHYGVRVPHKSYGYVKVCCPIHEESRPSASVRDNRMHCFSCGWHGDAIDLIMEKDATGYADAVKVAEEITGESGTQLPEQPLSGEWFSGSKTNQPRGRGTVASWRGWQS